MPDVYSTIGGAEMIIYFALLLLGTICIATVQVVHDNLSKRTVYDGYRRPERQKLKDIQRIYDTIRQAVNDNVSDQPEVEFDHILDKISKPMFYPTTSLYFGKDKPTWTV